MNPMGDQNEIEIQKDTLEGQCERKFNLYPPEDQSRGFKCVHLLPEIGSYGFKKIKYIFYHRESDLADHLFEILTLTMSLELF